MFSLLLPLRSQDAILFTVVPLLVLVADDVREGVTGLAADLDVRHCEIGPLDCDVLADEDIVELGTVFASEGSEGGCGGGTPGIPAPINIGLKRMGGRSWPACAIIANRSGLGNGIRVAIAIASCCCCHGLK